MLGIRSADRRYGEVSGDRRGGSGRCDCAVAKGFIRRLQSADIRCEGVCVPARAKRAPIQISADSTAAVS
jgi:hypothetical protein